MTSPLPPFQLPELSGCICTSLPEEPNLISFPILWQKLSGVFSKSRKEICGEKWNIFILVDSCTLFFADCFPFRSWLLFNLDKAKRLNRCNFSSPSWSLPNMQRRSRPTRQPAIFAKKLLNGASLPQLIEAKRGLQPPPLWKYFKILLL